MKVKTNMGISREKEIKERFDGAKTVAFLDFAIFFAVCWIVVALILSPLFRVHWFSPGDFSYSGAMYYHGIMVPVLILLFLLTQKVLSLKLANSRIYSAGAILSVLLVGLGSIFNAGEGISFAAIVQIIGMAMTDFLGITLVAALAIFALKNSKTGKIGIAFWLLFSSIIAILLAAPLGHLAGWFLDVGVKSFPGSSILLDTIRVTPDEFQEGLVGSHSHLIVAALLCGLAAVTAICFQDQSCADWKKRVSILGLWVTFVSLLLATVIYVFSALTGWEPPAFFTSGPNGIPLDDLVLTAGEIGILLLIVGLSGVKTGSKQKSSSFFQNGLRLAVFTAWIFGFVGAVVLGIYIEFHEIFYGAGAPPAPGALNDSVFIRAHLLFPFFMLPIIVTVLLAVACKCGRAKASRSGPFIFVWLSIIGMAFGLTGEILWFVTLGASTFLAAMVIMWLALIVGAISLWPGAGILPFTARTDSPGMNRY